MTTMAETHEQESRRRALIKIVRDARDGARAVTAPLSMYDGDCLPLLLLKCHGELL